MNDTWLNSRLVKLIQMVDNIDDVLLKLSLNPRAMYSIDTGQGKETVTAASMSMLLNAQDRIKQEIEDIYDELNGTGDPVYTRPSW